MVEIVAISFNGKNPYNLFKVMNRFGKYLISLVNKPKVNFCYIGTARNDVWYDRWFFNGFMKLRFGCNVTYMNVSKMSVQEMIEVLNNQDIIFVGSGDIIQMLQTWKDTGFIDALTHCDKLPILSGVSAGAMCWFISGLTDSIPGQYTPIMCLEWIKSSVTPHADDKTEKLCKFVKLIRPLDRLEAYEAAVYIGVLIPGLAIPNNCAVHFKDGKPIKYLTTDKGKNCYFVDTWKCMKQNTEYLP